MFISVDNMDTSLLGFNLRFSQLKFEFLYRFRHRPRPHAMHLPNGPYPVGREGRRLDGENSETLPNPT